MNGLRLRDAYESDLPRIVEIYNSTVPGRMVTADLEPISVESRRAWLRERDPSKRPLWVAEDEGEVVGWLSLGDFHDGRPAYHATVEVGVYVKDGHRGKGIGRRLVEEAIGRAGELGIETITAGAFAHNEPSVKLFESFGFEKWAHFPEVAEIDGVKRDLVILGLKVAKHDLS
ncbi:MAG: N-acetyltransferase family protein [Actinomycetota bacterium]|nr:N-acetyltransferase family protein [Actinomycetota bacterium]